MLTSPQGDLFPYIHCPEILTAAWVGLWSGGRSHSLVPCVCVGPLYLSVRLRRLFCAESLLVACHFSFFELQPWKLPEARGPPA